MQKKSAEDIADALDRKYGNEPIGSNFPAVLAKAVEAGGYTETTEIESVKRAVVAELKRIRAGRAV